MKNIAVSMGLSLCALAASVFVPPLLSVGGQYSLKGFPFGFYVPGGSDFGASFYLTEFLVDFALYTAIVFVLLLVLRRLRKPKVLR